MLAAAAGLVSVAVVTARAARLPLPQSPILALPPAAPPQADMARRIALGRTLFHDRRLSRSRRVSCASCHDLTTNGASRGPPVREPGVAAMSFDTPTVFNSVLAFRYGWEGRVRGLSDFTRHTMRVSMRTGPATWRRLAADPRLRKRVRAAYGSDPNEAVVVDALSTFVRTLVTPDAPFDRWLAGERDALTSRQVRGYLRFTSLGCASCHQGAAVGANIFQRRGIFHPLGDGGPRYLRVPSLRNVAVTGPYFHDGRAAKLPDAIRQMARAQLNLTISNRDVNDISAFLESLTGSYQGQRLRRPDRPPR
ncbi:cytochrome-c peroxidase [Sphingomonas sp. DT-51]|uniref:cytochrome-c peroxidase n=1 Tax=Sphingomonas sp. DT-51 TaxID=3396165 RepID=UPI003F1CDB57